jgi:hypothetical protein
MPHDSSHLSLQLLLQTSAASGLHALKRNTHHAAALLWQVCQCTSLHTQQPQSLLLLQIILWHFSVA